ncbi:lycopene cyclase domain-containing protein [Candidatus Parcubacteria bacterium]|nr:hypothetical protein [Patescibacteria group bacterium]MBU4309082.1 hypothetical protein [Patescibacteria group bacterium]MBU4432459.1 hypothetical protein [Patescibacteria group bacterium]MBU4577443.1 hypothetical protein [Patescibacteria group bacterium]MCG2697131.1 lycopene cyclase domain-containing protein [Candidatus Parcubacteria bacterium]
MIAYKYTYLIGSLLFFIYWLYLFIKLKEYRQRLLLISLLYAILGVTFGLVYTADWWRPETIFGYRVGVEDFLLGFSNAGIAAIWYLLFLKIKSRGQASWARIAIPLISTGIITLVLFKMFDWNSFYANSIGILTAIIYILIKRTDLIKISLMSGVMMILISLPIYLLMIFVSPGWVEHTWMLEKLSGILFIGIPIEDFIWYFLVGAMVSIVYPYYSEEKYI